MPTSILRKPSVDLLFSRVIDPNIQSRADSRTNRGLRYCIRRDGGKAFILQPLSLLSSLKIAISTSKSCDTQKLLAI